MSENQVTQANNTHLMSTQSNSTNSISFNNTAASENNSPPMSLFQHKQMNFDNTSSTMNLNLNGFFLPNNCANKSHLNLNELNNGNEFLYGGGSTTTRSSPLQSLCEVSSPASSGNSKTYKHTVQPNLHQNKISPSMFENEDNLDIEDDDENKHVTKLFVGNLPTSTTLQELLIVFKKFGPVNEKLSVVKDHNYAFIHFYNRKDAQVALKEVNDSLFKDRYIRVQFSTSQGYTYSKFKNTKSDKKRCEFRNEEMFNHAHPGYYLNNSSSNQMFLQQGMGDFDSNFGEFDSLQNRSVDSQFQGSLLSQVNKNGMSTAFRPIIGTKLEQSMSRNSNFCIPKSSQTKDAWESFQMLQANNLLIEAHKLSLQRKEQTSQYEQFERQQRQNLMQILYLRQLESQQKQHEQQMSHLSRSATLTNMNSAGLLNRTNMPLNTSNNLLSDMSSLFLDSNFLRQSYNPTPASNIVRSNTLFSFKNN